MNKQSNLRNQIQALRNQAKARGHVSFENEEELKEKAFEQHESQTKHPHILPDLLKAGIFLIIAILILLTVSIKVSTLPLFGSIRNILHISVFSSF